MSKLLIAGVDEVGRGPLAGPVITAAVILDSNYVINGLADSKKLTEKKRQMLDKEIRRHALSYAIGRAEVEEIDQLNILHATMLAMQRAVAGLDVQPNKILVDGNRYPELPCPAQAIIGGDGLVPEISAASIIAKVHRDNLMQELHQKYPLYGFDSNKGYPTLKHRQALISHGVTDCHRQSFAPVRNAMKAV